MEYIVILIICILTILILKFAFNIKRRDMEEIKKIGYDKELNKITDKLPSNRKVCEEILKMLNNKEVEIETSEEKEGTLSYYSVLTNKIIIADINDTFTRIQTIAHECLHSVQNKRMLMFNFIFSNIYLLYFGIILILTLFRVIKNPIIWTVLLIILGIVYYAIRSFLETDAMTKAPYLAKEYIEKTKLLSEEEIKIIMQNYKVLNNMGIPLTNFQIVMSNVIKIAIATGTVLLAY